jgi:hypothetical protein
MRKSPVVIEDRNVVPKARRMLVAVGFTERTELRRASYHPSGTSPDRTYQPLSLAS